MYRRVEWTKQYKADHPSATKEEIKIAWKTEYERIQTAEDAEHKAKLHALSPDPALTADPLDAAEAAAEAELRSLAAKAPVVDWSPESASRAVFLACGSTNLAERLLTLPEPFTGYALSQAPSFLPTTKPGLTGLWKAFSIISCILPRWALI
jgi:hypothetical protein